MLLICSCADITTNTLENNKKTTQVNNAAPSANVELNVDSLTYGNITSITVENNDSITYCIDIQFEYEVVENYNQKRLYSDSLRFELSLELFNSTEAMFFSKLYASNIIGNNDQYNINSFIVIYGNELFKPYSLVNSDKILICLDITDKPQKRQIKCNTMFNSTEYIGAFATASVCDNYYDDNAIRAYDLDDTGWRINPNNGELIQWPFVKEMYSIKINDTVYYVSDELMHIPYGKTIEDATRSITYTNLEKKSSAVYQNGIVYIARSDGKSVKYEINEDELIDINQSIINYIIDNYD